MPDSSVPSDSAAPFREALAFHAHGETSEKFEASLGQAIDLCSDDGYEVTGISHAANVSYGDHYDAVLYSAVVWCHRFTTEN